ncbi:hypothetical protein PFISCL1PPCAC_24462 [Pristionchus fissidentatus]|uniref:Carbonic anhydrase n=1 Tax=Pristionchus fissidentatus TaxID=1538716 RepID=A0AAV5WRJ5_9BILA|nr:hypothetical protein PFISCL1PPCAC_24462 [Pristionchus fissidentatus]
MSMKKRNVANRQSPIDIKTKKVVADPDKCSPLTIRFNHGDCVDVAVNDEGNWKVSVRPHSTSLIRGSHLTGTYRLLQFHAHWGGSEHLIDGKRFDAEIHFVYWNTRYYSMDEACKRGDGLAVLGVLVEKGAENTAFTQLLRQIEESNKLGKPVRIPISFDPTRLIPRSGLSKYYTYLGGLTTPPYSECVVWTVMQTPITMSEAQLKTLSTLTTENWRECQRVHARKVYATKGI